MCCCCVYLYIRGNLYNMQPLPPRICRDYLYNLPMDERAQRIQNAIDEITQIQDPKARAKAATEALELIHAANGVLAKLRRADIKTMRGHGLTYRAIAEAIGIHFTRVKQIETGAPTGTSARSRAAKAAGTEGE